MGYEYPEKSEFDSVLMKGSFENGKEGWLRLKLRETSPQMLITVVRIPLVDALHP